MKSFAIRILLYFAPKITLLRFNNSHPKGKKSQAKIFNDTNKYLKSLLILLLRFHLYSIFESRENEGYGKYQLIRRRRKSFPIL
jgi:hypothetical protein